MHGLLQRGITRKVEVELVTARVDTLHDMTVDLLAV